MAPGRWAKPVLFTLVAIAVAGYGLILEAWWLRVLLFWTAIAFSLLAAGYAGLGYRIYAKRADGRLPWWAYLLHGPCLTINVMLFVLQNRLFSEPVCHQITDRLWLGRYTQCSPDAFGEGLISVLDLTAEFPAARWEREASNYCCIPVLDACPMTLPQLQQAVDWIEAATKHGPIYVHCALGHSRSATVLAAVLLQTEAAQSTDQAIKIIRNKRPAARPNSRQMTLLTQWSRQRTSNS